VSDPRKNIGGKTGERRSLRTVKTSKQKIDKQPHKKGGAKVKGCRGVQVRALGEGFWRVVQHAGVAEYLLYCGGMGRGRFGEKTIGVMWGGLTLFC